MGFFSKKPKAPPPKPIAYLDIMRAPENSFFIALRTDSGAPPDHNAEPDTSPLEDTEAEHGSAGIGTHKGVPSAPTLPPTQADEPHLQDSAFSPMSATKNPPFYSTSIHKKKLKKDTAGIWHGMPASGTLFAEIKGQKIQFHGSMESIIKRRQLLSRTWVFGQYKGTEVFEFIQPKNSPHTLQLWPKRKSPTARHPIAVFDIKSGEPDSLGEIRIYEPEMPIDALLSQTKQGDQIATSPTIMNSPSQPTDLLDTAVLAWIAYRSFNTGGSLVKSLEFRDL